MATMREIRASATRIAEEFHPRTIILFGSHAEGRARADSDVDILVVMPFEGKACRQAWRILERLQPRLPVDLLVRAPRELARRVEQGDYFLRDILDQGKVLHEATHG